MNNDYAPVPDVMKWPAGDLIEAMSATDEMGHHIAAIAMSVLLAGSYDTIGDDGYDTFVEKLKQVRKEDPSTVKNYGEVVRIMKNSSEIYFEMLIGMFLTEGVILPDNVTVPDDLEGVEGA